jgi:uroporphyrinogen III methyltransferase/synthase
VVTIWPIYETIPVKPAANALDWLKSGYDVIAFASPSAVDSFCDGIGKQVAPSKNCVIACIGPMTAQRARDRKMTVDIVPDTADFQGLVSALIDRFSSQVSGEV